MLRNARAAIGLVLTAVLVLTGCTALGGKTNTTSDGSLQNVHVSILNSADLVPFWLAQDEGYFKAEGLNVTSDVAPTGDKSQTKVISGESQISLTTYPLFFVAMSKPDPKKNADLVIVADGTYASPNSNAILTIPTSPVKNVADLAGRRIAVTSPNSTSDILTKSVLIEHGVDPNTVKFLYQGLPDMAASLQNNQVDAIYQPEPFIHQAAAKISATPIIDVATGGTLAFPITGYIATRKWVQDNPKALAGFQRALAKGVKLATADRDKANAVIVKYSKTTPDVAQLMTLPAYSPSADARRIQRVPDLMLKLGAIATKVDAAPLIAVQAAA